MTKRKKITLLCIAATAVACLGVAIPLLIAGEDSSQSESSNADTSSAEVSVSISGSFSTSEEIDGESSNEGENSKESESSEERTSESVENSDETSETSAENNDSISQTSDSMSATNDSSSPEASSPIELAGLGAHGLSIPSTQGKTGVEYSFAVPETGLYALSSQSVLESEEGLALTYTVEGFTDYVTYEKKTLALKEGEVLLLTAYVYDESLFIDDSFSMDFSITRLLDLGENTLSFTDKCEVYFLPFEDGEYLFTASEGVRILYFSTTSLRNEELTKPLSLTAGMEIRLILQLEDEENEEKTITITVKRN